MGDTTKNHSDPGGRAPHPRSQTLCRIKPASEQIMPSCCSLGHHLGQSCVSISFKSLQGPAPGKWCCGHPTCQVWSEMHSQALRWSPAPSQLQGLSETCCAGRTSFTLRRHEVQMHCPGSGSVLQTLHLPAEMNKPPISNSSGSSAQRRALYVGWAHTQASAFSPRMPVQIKLTDKDCLWLEEVIAGSPSGAQELVSQQTPEGAGYVYTHVTWWLETKICDFFIPG